MGEGSHGTHEFYSERARITQRLIEEKNFNAIAIEGDWPNAMHIHRFIQGGEGDAELSLSQFKRFPRWMWRNKEVLALIEWLRNYNNQNHNVGFYGLDLYGMYPAINEIIAYLEKTDPESSERARERYSCFGTEGEQAYGRAVYLGVSEPCRRGAISELVALRRSYVDSEEHFLAEENAKLISDAEEYYRSMFADPASSWNLRDRHMADTLDHLIAHLDRRGRGKIIIWAHNSHVSDALATSASRRGELTLGQLARERHGEDVVLVGLTTYDGSVTAAHDWGGEGKIYNINPAHADSVENLFHQTGINKFLLIPEGPVAETLASTFSQRAIGVIYRPETERQSHYMSVIPASEFDAFIHIDRTQALRPLDKLTEWIGDEPPDTYPTSL